MKHEHCIIEALLFVSQKPLPSTRIAEILRVDTKEATRLIEEYTAILMAKNSAIQVIKDPDGYKLGTRREYAPYVELLVTPKETKLSYQSLETLSIIAIRQPITKQEIEKIRGIGSDGIINALHTKGLIKIVGMKKIAGNPKLFGISKDFFKYFGIRSMGEFKTFLKSIEADTSKIDALLAEEPGADANVLFEDPNQESFDFDSEKGAAGKAETEMEKADRILTEGEAAVDVVADVAAAESEAAGTSIDGASPDGVPALKEKPGVEPAPADETKTETAA